MKLPVFSIRTIFGIIIIMMGVLALILAMLSGSIHRDLVLDNQKKMIREMINISVKERIKDLNSVSKDLGLALQSTKEFKSAFKNKNKNLLNELLNNQFHQYFVTAGVIQLKQISLFNTDLSIIQEASEGYVFFKNTRTCENLLNKARDRKGAERMKAIQGLCLYHDKPVNVVLVPVGGLFLKGYILIVSNPIHNLKALEIDLGMPVVLQIKNKPAVFKSKRWPLDESNALISDLSVNTSSDQHALTVLTAQDLTLLTQSLKKSRIEVLFITGCFTLLIIIISIFIIRKTMLIPLHQLAIKLRNFDSETWTEESSLKNYGVKEIGELSQGFNIMAHEQKKAQKSDLQKSKFLANMSHEIRTPLTAIIGFSETLYNQGKTQDWKKHLSRILSNGKHLNQLINDILDLSKIEADQLSVENISVNLGIMLFELSSIISEQAKSKGLEFKIDYNFPLPEQITTDPTRLKQILINLCGNAVKFTEKGNVTVTVSYDKEVNKMLFSIKDNGIGMTEKQLASLFKPFTQADSSITRKYGGTGLGLHISKLLTEKLGGNINASSITGVGSHFEVTIDAGEIGGKWIDPEMDFETVTNNEEVSIPKLEGEILLAEDNPDNQNLISLFVGMTGAGIDIADNGKIALEKASAKTYDFILMDMQMPVMGGIESIKLLRKNNITTPIAVLTANAMKEDITLSEEAGADYFLTKPLDKNKFYTVLKKHLGKTENKSKSKSKTYESEGFKKLRLAYLSQLSEKNRQLQTLYDNKDWDSFLDLIHKLKGTGTSFGFSLITEYCGSIEEKLRRHEYDEIDNVYRTLTRYIESLHQ